MLMPNSSAEIVPLLLMPPRKVFPLTPTADTKPCAEMMPELLMPPVKVDTFATLMPAALRRWWRSYRHC